jgi:hypothetical protein
MANDDDARKKSPETRSGDEADSSKREFLTKSGALLAVLGAISTGTFTTLSGQTKPTPAPSAREAAKVAPQAASRMLAPNEVGQLKLVMSNAMQTGNMEGALKQHGQGLPADVQGILRSLNAQDLRAAAALEQKLGALRSHVAADNNGTIGM